ncbi:MAG: hypothetical protein V4850_14150 [Myxococcota bacterium]
MMVMWLAAAAAWARCSDDWFVPRAEVLATSGDTLPAGAAPWLIARGSRRSMILRDEAGQRVLVRRVGRSRVVLVPWLPLRRGERYEVWMEGEPAFSFEVTQPRDTTPPGGGKPIAWVHRTFQLAEGRSATWTLALSALDEPTWFEAEAWHDGARSGSVHLLDAVMMPRGESALAHDRFRASLSSDAVTALGNVPAAAISFGAGPCGGGRLPAGEGALFVRLRLFDAAGNFTAWTEPYVLDGEGGGLDDP